MRKALKFILMLCLVPVGAFVLLFITALSYQALDWPVDLNAKWTECINYAAGILAGWWIRGNPA